MLKSSEHLIETGRDADDRRIEKAFSDLRQFLLKQDAIALRFLSNCLGQCTLRTHVEYFCNLLHTTITELSDDVVVPNSKSLRMCNLPCWRF